MPAGSSSSPRGLGGPRATRTAWRWSAATRPAGPLDHQRAAPGACRARHGAAPQRRARAGLLAVTGTLGDAGAGLGWRDRSRATPAIAARSELHRAFRVSRPRGSIRMRARAASRAPRWISPTDWSAICRSWRARADLRRASTSSGCRCRARCAAARRCRSRRATGRSARGDDYELLLAVPPGASTNCAASRARLNLTLTAIGEFAAVPASTWVLNGSRIYVPGVQRLRSLSLTLDPNHSLAPAVPQYPFAASIEATSPQRPRSTLEQHSAKDPAKSLTGRAACLKKSAST